MSARSPLRGWVGIRGGGGNGASAGCGLTSGVGRGAGTLLVRFRRSLAGRGIHVQVGGGCLGIRPGLWSVGSGWLLVDGACWHGLRVGGLQVVVGCSL